MRVQIRRSTRMGAALLGGALLIAAGAAPAQEHGQEHGHGRGAHQAPGDMAHPGPGAAAPEARELVDLPPPMAAHTLANMRDHLRALEEINAALAAGDHDAASQIAEQRLGLSALDAHGAHQVAEFMPEGMRAAGLAMHQAASRFALAAQDADVTGELRPALGALSEVVAACNACHAGYRFK